METISKLSTIEPPPPVISFTPVFILTENDSIAVTTFQMLKHIYSSSYTGKYKLFTEFLFDALNQKTKLQVNDKSVRLYYEQVFKIDTTISTFYKNESINGLIRHFVAPDKNGYILKNNGLSLNEINSISFYFFIHHFIRQDDDYNASIHFIKLSSVLDGVVKDATDNATNTNISAMQVNCSGYVRHYSKNN